MKPSITPDPFETKYVLPQGDSLRVLHTLRGLGRPDPVHPSNYVHSVYYDTDSDTSYEECLAGAFKKTKVRVRWYESPPGQEQESAAFLELKHKWGGARGKVRVPSPWSSRRHSEFPLESSDWLRLLRRLEGEGLPLNGFAPVCEIVYLRSRFQLADGSRISLDRGIQVRRVHRARFGLPPSGSSPWAVLEVKGRQRSLPGQLRPLRPVLTRRSFSKYGWCRSHLVRDS